MCTYYQKVQYHKQKQAYTDNTFGKIKWQTDVVYRTQKGDTLNNSGSPNIETAIGYPN